jgi:NAD(P)-dependent dehydrogenase (short-subunit alcohol dehydrogenase family)
VGDATMRTVQGLQDLRGRTALVTGGAGHLGRAAADALAELGAGIVVLDLDPAACRAEAERIRAAHGVDADGLAVDLADEAGLRAALRDLVGRSDGPHVVVNAAAMVGTTAAGGWAVPFAEQRTDAWRQALEVNLTACFVVVQELAPALTANRGSVVNVSSIYGMVGPDLRLYEGTGLGNPAAYAASKGGLVQLTRWMATVLAPGVRVNALTCGGIERGQAAPFQERYRARTPLGRMAVEEDFKGAIAYLASDLSAYVTGQNLVVDGGWTSW